MLVGVTMLEKTYLSKPLYSIIHRRGGVVNSLKERDRREVGEGGTSRRGVGERETTSGEG